MTSTTDGSTGPSTPKGAASGATRVGTLSAVGETEQSPPVQQRPEPRAFEDLVAQTTDRAKQALLRRQSEHGWWKGDLETNVTMDAEDLLLRRFLGISDERTTAAAARFIRGEQRADGTWATFYGGPGDLSTTIEAYVALRLAGDDPQAEHMARAAEFVRGKGGVARSRVFTRIWLALFGWWSWDELPEMPPEMLYLPKWFPLGIYSFGSWARQTIVPLTVVCAFRPSCRAPFRLDELHRDAARPIPPRKFASPTTWQGALQRLDRSLHAYRRVHSRVLRRAALRSAERWIVARQENDGCFGGIQPPAVYSLMALHLLGYDLQHPVMQAGLSALDSFAVWREQGSPGSEGEQSEAVADGPTRMIEACQSPVWDTCLATIALADAGLPRDHPALRSAAEWMLGEQVLRQGDWSVQRPGLAPGGWSFEFENDNYPDTDDTSEVALALRRVALPDQQRVDWAVARAVTWNLGMQSKQGAWGAFDVDNTSPFPNRLPFCDFGEVIDPPSADVTGHVVEMLAVEGRQSEPRFRKAIAWLLAEQEANGAWFGRWGVNYLYGTGSVVPALVAAGLPSAHPAIRRAVRWVESVQNDDGGWGEDLRSYIDAEWVANGASTASQTGWALMALLAAGERDSEAVRRGVRWLAETQQADGTWDEPYFTGTGFPWDFSINYHLYRLVFPLTALGRYLNGDGLPSRTA